jgi:hypothetical protein
MGECLTETFEGQQLMLTQGFQQVDPSGSIQGIVTYDNNSSTPIDSAVVELYNGQQLIRQAVTGNNGLFVMQSVPPGNYLLTASCSLPWGGGNAVDALHILRHFSVISLLSGLRLLAADVNEDDNINAIDALQVMRRFVQLIDSFPKGDWLFQQQEIILLPGHNQVLNLRGICTGDVDGSYIP